MSGEAPPESTTTNTRTGEACIAAAGGFVAVIRRGQFVDDAPALPPAALTDCLVTIRRSWRSPLARPRRIAHTRPPRVLVARPRERRSHARRRRAAAGRRRARAPGGEPEPPPRRPHHHLTSRHAARGPTAPPALARPDRATSALAAHTTHQPRLLLEAASSCARSARPFSHTTSSRRRA